MSLIYRPNCRFGYRSVLGVLLWAGCLSAGIDANGSEEVESQTRDFVVQVDGKQTGQCSVRISRLDDDSEVLYGKSSVTMSYVVYTYRYASKGKETWKDGRLQALQNESDFNGTKYRVLAERKGEDMRLKLNGQERKVSPEICPTSYWKQPDPKWHDKKLPLFDPDKGEDRRGTLKFVGKEQVPIAGKPQKCAHFQIRGDIEVDLWYDAQERLVRQESKEMGHRVVMELKQIDDNPKKSGRQIAKQPG
jgi:hypothetical protein